MHGSADALVNLVAIRVYAMLVGIFCGDARTVTTLRVLGYTMVP